MSPARRSIALPALVFLWLATLALAPLVGAERLDLAEAFSGGTLSARILFELRVPRVLLALAAGGILAVAGASFQSLFRNPLAEPYTLGVAGGGALGAVLAIRAGLASGWLGLSAASFLGAVGATVLVVGLARRGANLEASRLLLAGVAVSFSCSALILFVQYSADPHQSFRIVRWMMGGLTVVGYSEAIWVAIWALMLVLVLITRRWELDLLLAGEETAASRGVDLDRLRVVVLGAASLAIAATVAVAGPIGFVGLIVPQALRRLLGHSHARLLPASLLAGGAFLTVCDLAARTLFAPAEMPVGVLTALLGGPAFLWVLLRRER